jgi:flagellar motor switch protein FliM
MQQLTASALRSSVESKSDDMGLLPQGFTRFAKALSRNFAQLAPASPGFSYESHVKSAPVIPDEAAVIFLLQCPAPVAQLRLTLDRALVFGLCDVMFGGVGNEPPFAEARPLSNIEQAIAGMFAGYVGSLLPQAFATEPFSLHKPSDDQEEAPFSSAVTVTLLGTMHGYSGEMKIELPEALAGLFKPQASLQAPEACAPNIEKIPVNLVAVLGDLSMSLEDLTRLSPGQTVRLNSTIATPISLESEGVELCKARLGQNARRFCLSVL